MSATKGKLESQMRDFLSSFLREKISDPRLTFVSITKVELNRDNSVAKVYWDTFDANKRGDVKRGIESATMKLKSELSKALRIRKTPNLVFLYDSQYEAESHIDLLLKSDDSE